MDQTINEMLYTARVRNTVKYWNENLENNGTIIASDGTSYKKIDGKLVQIVDPKLMKRVNKVVVPTLKEYGLLGETKEVQTETTIASSELVAGL